MVQALPWIVKMLDMRQLLKNVGRSQSTGS